METLAVSLKEKIIIYVDTSNDVMLSKLSTADHEPVNSFERLQKLIRIFMTNKEATCSNGDDFNQFALMVDLGGSPSLLDSGDFHDANGVMERLALIRLRGDASGSSGNSEEKALDIGEVINAVKQNVYVHSSNEMPDSNEGMSLHITRLIMFVTRCHSSILLNVTEDLKRVLENPYFVVDVLYLHEKPSNENLVESNLLTLTQLNELQQERGYVLDSEPDVTNWCNINALLLPNPRIRSSMAERERARTEEKRPMPVLITLS